MRNTLRTHIIFLENTVQSLRNRLTRPGLSIEEVEDIELQLSTSESALDHYRKAYALEAELRVPEPPNHPTGSEPAGEDERPEKSSSRKKNEGLARFAMTAKRQMSQQCRNLSARSRMQLPFGKGLDALEKHSHVPSRAGKRALR
jgi:hypothetical protein